MLLNEIVSTRKETSSGTYEYVPDFEKSNLLPMGVKLVTLTPHIEELEMYARLGLNSTNPPKFPVVFAYTLTKKSDNPEEQQHITGLMDALKKRNPKHTMSDEHLNEIYSNALKRIMKLDTPTYLSGPSKQGYTHLKNILNHSSVSSSVVIVPLASSSPVVRMMAESLAEVTKAPVLDLFSKESWPEQSPHYFTKERGYEPRKNWISPKKHKLELEQELSSLEQTDPETEAELNKITKRMDQINNQLKQTFQIKNAGKGQRDFERGFYGFQKADPTIVSKIQGKIIILVDDNLVSSVTMIDAAKAFYRVGVVPKQLFGIVVHKYQ